MFIILICTTTDSTFETLSRRSTAEWKKNIQVVFTNEQGVEESGSDSTEADASVEQQLGLTEALQMTAN